MRRQIALLLGVSILALLALAAVFIPAPHSGGDNAGYLALAYSLSEGTGYRELWDPATPLHTKYPPVFPLLLAALIVAGATTWTSFKVFILLSTAGAVVFAFLWGSVRRGPAAAVAVAFLTLLSSGWIDASRWILSEPIFLLFTFLSLWSAEKGMIGEEGGWQRDRWLLLAGGAALLALMTRSAGLPLVLALLGAFLMHRAIRSAALLGVGFALLSGWWFLRARSGTGDGAYQSEFWMVNPYQPELGEIRWLDLPLRVFENLWIYLGTVLPSQWWGGGGGAVAPLLGVAIGGVALLGLTLRLRRFKVGAAELFLPFYAGIILLWPPVWSGERFLLPLLPLLLLLSGEALWEVSARLGRWRLTLLTAGTLLLALPAIPGWFAMADSGGSCRRLASSGDPFRCHPAGFQEFRGAAIWSGANLPEDATVLNRKPRIFFLLGGPKGAIYPFTSDPDLLLAEADRAGARYLLFDHVDGISPGYLPPLISARGRSFCYIGGWGSESPGALRTELLGILLPEDRGEGGGLAEIGACPEGYTRSGPEGTAPGGDEVPLLVGG